MSCEQRPNFIHWDGWSKTGRDKDYKEHPGGTKILRNMHLVRPEDVPPQNKEKK